MPNSEPRFIKSAQIGLFSAIFLLAILAAPKLFAQNDAESPWYKTEVDHLSYITGNLDSLVQAWTKNGYTLVKADANPASQRFLELRSGVAIDFTGVTPEITTDWRADFVKHYNSRASSLWIRVPNVDSVDRRMGWSDSARSHVTKMGDVRALALDLPGPLEIVLFSGKGTPPKKAVKHKNNSTHLQWIVISASREIQMVLRKLFATLDLPKKTEIWKDYWIMGPPNRRSMIRFEAPPPEAADAPWMSIEDAGLVFSRGR